MNTTQPITVPEMARRFGRSNRAAAALMRRMRHVGEGRGMFTTEEWLAEWLAAECVPQQNWPKQNLDPLEEAVSSRVIQLVGALVASGKFQVVNV